MRQLLPGRIESCHRNRRRAGSGDPIEAVPESPAKRGCRRSNSMSRLGGLAASQRDLRRTTLDVRWFFSLAGRKEPDESTIG